VNILLLIAIVLMVVAAFGVSPKGINLWYLGWAFALASMVFSGFVIHT
jgi:hypothetical protein